MQNKRIGVVFILAMVMIPLFFIRWAEAQRTPDWWIALSGYAPQTRVIQAVKASKPWNFHAGMTNAGLTFGPFAYIAAKGQEEAHTARLALPEPPHVVYCVQTKEGANDRLLFVNYYSDNLWQSGWVIFDAGPVSHNQALAIDLNTLGCDWAY